MAGSENTRLSLRRQIKPVNAPAVVTLGDARFFIESLLTNEQRNHPVWQYAAAVINGAAATGEARDIDEATRAFEAALRHEGLLHQSSDQP